jgi:DNA-binding GntR family transcriptional regulator
MTKKAAPPPGGQDFLMREQAYLHIQRKIFSGELRAGKAVSELSLAKELGTSRTPIREALGQLVGEGLLEQTPNRGVVVVEFGRRDLVELFELREALEVFAVGRAALKSFRNSDLERLQTLADEILVLKNGLDRSGREALSSSQLQQFIRSDMGFHTLLIRMAENPRISKVINDTRLLIRIFATRGLPKVAELESIYEHHSAVLQAVRQGDSDGAMRVMGNHIQTSLRDRLDEFDHLEREASLGRVAPFF